MSQSDLLLQLEARRCAAICAADGEALEKTMSEDYVHVHANGDMDTRGGFIEGVLVNPRLVERGPLAVRLYGDVAILIGEQLNRRGDHQMLGILQQVAAKRDGVWRFVSGQMTRIG